jgi:tetratricopeptide (TPR) repeat protein
MRQLWPGLHVNFENSLNTAVNSLRNALGDSPKNSRFIETRAGLGYRFIAPVDEITHTSSSSTRTSNFGAHEDYLKGRHFQDKMTEEDLRKSIAYFESAISEDPTSAQSYAGLADTYILLATLGALPSTEARDRAKELVESALQRAQELPECRISLAWIKNVFDLDWPAAELEYLRALDLNPRHADGHRKYASFLAATGRTEEALREIRRAQELDPVSFVITTERAWIEYVGRDFERAIEQSWKLLALEPRFAPAQHTLGLAYEQAGMFEEAITELQNARICSGQNPVTVAALGHAYASAGKHQEAREILQELEVMSERRYVSCYWKSIVYAGIGMSDLALEALQKCREERDVWFGWVNVEPRFDRIRTEARFRDLLHPLTSSEQPQRKQAHP